MLTEDGKNQINPVKTVDVSSTTNKTVGDVSEELKGMYIFIFLNVIMTSSIIWQGNYLDDNTPYSLK